MAAAEQKVEHLVEPLDDQPVIRRRKLDDAEMDITPMIDITFLLLIFFLVAARLDEDTPVELPPARHGTAVAIKSSVILTLAESEGEHAEVYQGDGKAADRLIPANDLDAQEAAIVDYIEEQISEGKSSVLIKAEKGVKHRDVARVSTAVAKAGSGDLFVAVLEVQ
ncbi:MAG: biopolymer transporter ExbD [Planctomycetaceae bacterium]|nr:biopolymer transporter ExbD [Planctomycetaceae bacterium]